MAKQQQQQLPGEGLSDQQQGALVQLGQMMGPHADEFDQKVQDLHSQRHKAEHDAADYDSIYGDKPFAHEAGYEKMRTAQMGLAPSDIEQEQSQQQSAQAKTQAQQQAATAQQAQAQQTSPNAPPAPAGPVGVSTPFEAQKGPQPAPGAQDVEPEVPGMQGPASQIQPPQQPDQDQGQ